MLGGGGCQARFPSGPLSVRGVGAAKGLLPCVLVPKGKQPTACTLALWWLKFGPTESQGRGGGAAAHLLAPLLFSVCTRGAGKFVPSVSGLGREAGERDAEPARGDLARPHNLCVTMTSYQTAPRWLGGTRRHSCAVPLGLDLHFMSAFSTSGGATCARSSSPQPRAYPGQAEGPQGAESASLPCMPPVLAAQAVALQPAYMRGPRVHHTRMASPLGGWGGQVSVGGRPASKGHPQLH